MIVMRNFFGYSIILDAKGHKPMCCNAIFLLYKKAPLTTNWRTQLKMLCS